MYVFFNKMFLPLLQKAKIGLRYLCRKIRHKICSSPQNYLYYTHYVSPSFRNMSIASAPLPLRRTGRGKVYHYAGKRHATSYGTSSFLRL